MKPIGCTLVICYIAKYDGETNKPITVPPRCNDPIGLIALMLIHYHIVNDVAVVASNVTVNITYFIISSC